MQAQEVFMSATHTNRSTGYYSRYLLYIEEDNKNAAFLQRDTDDPNLSEFMNFDILATVNDEGAMLKCDTDESHPLSNQFGMEQNSDD